MDNFKRINMYRKQNEAFRIKNTASDCTPNTLTRGVQTPMEKNAVQTVHFDELCRVDV